MVIFCVHAQKFKHPPPYNIPETGAWNQGSSDKKPYIDYIILIQHSVLRPAILFDSCVLYCLVGQSHNFFYKFKYILIKKC